MTATGVTPVARAARAGLVILTLINLFNYLDRWIVAALAESMKHSELRLSDGQLGSLMTGFLIVYMLAAPLFGSLGDRRSRPRLLALGVGIWSIATALAGRAQRLPDIAPQSAVCPHGPGIRRIHLRDRRSGVLDAVVSRTGARHSQGAGDGTVRRNRRRDRFRGHVRRRLARRPPAASVPTSLSLGVRSRYAAGGAAYACGPCCSATQHLLACNRSR